MDGASVLIGALLSLLTASVRSVGGRIPLSPIATGGTSRASRCSKSSISKQCWVQNDLYGELLEFDDSSPNATASFPPSVWVKT